MKLLRVSAFLMFVSVVILTAPRMVQARHFDEGSCDTQGGASVPNPATDLQVLTACFDFVAESSDSLCAVMCGSGFVCDSADGCDEIRDYPYSRYSGVTLHCKRPSEM